MILDFLNGGNTEEWEGIDNPVESYENLTSHEYGWEMVAEGEYCAGTNTSRISYVIDKMGASAKDSLF